MSGKWKELDGVTLGNKVGNRGLKRREGEACKRSIEAAEMNRASREMRNRDGAGMVKN